MPDMLCSLVRLPKVEPLLEELRKEDITVRRPNPWDRTALAEFIETHFSKGWSDEIATAFASKPITCYIALDKGKIIGFGGYDCTRRNFFGPTGVNEEYRGKGIGKAIFYACLYGLQELGYVYAIIGDAGPVKFYEKAVGAMVIPIDDGKGIYTLQEEPRFLSY
jgi:GNAT superfamily N-acetyltransferase